MDNKEVLLLKKALDRQKRARMQAEKILEEKSMELYDVTHHLKESNARLENLLSKKTSELDGVFINIVDPYVVMDLQFNIVKMNASAKEFLGYDSEKESVNLSRIVHPEYIQYTVESMKSLMEVGVLKNYQAKIIIKDKTEKFIQINSSLIYDKNRKPIAAQGIIRDITEPHNQHKELRKSKQRLETLIVDKESAVLLEDENNKILSTNKEICELFHIPEEPELLKGQDSSNAAE